MSAPPAWSRTRWLGVALAVTLLLVWQAPAPDRPAEPVQPHGAEGAGADLAPQLELLGRHPAAEAYVDLFAVREARPDRTAQPPLAEAPPAPPPLRFSFVGRMVEEGRTKLFLQDGQTLHVVQEGDMLGRDYRLLRLEGGRIELLYLPLNMTQTMNVGHRLE